MDLADALFIAAAVASGATLAAHVILGGRLFVRPLLASTLRSPVKYTLYYCWHLVSAALLVMGAAFAFAALAPEARAAAHFGLALAALFLATNVAQNLAMRLSFALHPQGAFFLIVTALGAAGLAYG
jgi:hypothetical protein